MARNEHHAHALLLAHAEAKQQLPLWAQPSTCKRPARRPGLFARFFSFTF